MYVGGCVYGFRANTQTHTRTHAHARTHTHIRTHAHTHNTYPNPHTKHNNQTHTFNLRSTGKFLTKCIKSNKFLCVIRVCVPRNREYGMRHSATDSCRTVAYPVCKFGGARSPRASIKHLPNTLIINDSCRFMRRL